MSVQDVAAIFQRDGITAETLIANADSLIEGLGEDRRGHLDFIGVVLQDRPALIEDAAKSMRS